MVQPRKFRGQRSQGRDGGTGLENTSHGTTVCGYTSVREEKSFPLYSPRLEPRSPANRRFTREKNSLKGVQKENWLRKAAVRLLRQIFLLRLNIGKEGWAGGGGGKAVLLGRQESQK